MALKDSSCNTKHTQAFQPPPTMEPIPDEPLSTTETLMSLCLRLKNGCMRLDAPYQREFVWSAQRMNGLIDSIFKNVAIPPIYVCDDGNGRWTVMDGKQRLTTIVKYCASEFKYCGKHFKELDDTLRLKFENKSLTIIKYVNLTEDQEHEIFERIQNGAPLTGAERVNAHQHAQEFHNLETAYKPILDHKRKAAIKLMVSYLFFRKNRKTCFYQPKLRDFMTESLNPSTAECRLAVDRLRDILDKCLVAIPKATKHMGDDRPMCPVEKFFLFRVIDEHMLPGRIQLEHVVEFVCQQRKYIQTVLPRNQVQFTEQVVKCLTKYLDKYSFATVGTTAPSPHVTCSSQQLTMTSFVTKP